MEPEYFISLGGFGSLASHASIKVCVKAPGSMVRVAAHCYGYPPPKKSLSDAVLLQQKSGVCQG